MRIRLPDESLAAFFVSQLALAEASVSADRGGFCAECREAMGDVPAPEGKYFESRARGGTSRTHCGRF